MRVHAVRCSSSDGNFSDIKLEVPGGKELNYKLNFRIGHPYSSLFLCVGSIPLINIFCEDLYRG
jgi:hypothetical protein